MLPAIEELHRPPHGLVKLELFLLELFRELSGPTLSSEFADCPPWLADACQAIRKQKNFSKGAAELARLCGRSQTHVTRVLRKLTGKSANEVVNAARLDYAGIELMRSTKSIGDISRECGFDSLSHFYRLFRKRYRATPRQYRIGKAD